MTLNDCFICKAEEWGVAVAASDSEYLEHFIHLSMLVNDGVFTIEKAAEKAGMSVEEFKNAMKSTNAQSRE